MGASESKVTDTINWNNVKTNDISSSIPNMKSITKEAYELINKLNFSENLDTTSSELDVNNFFEKSNNVQEIKNDTKLENDSSSSPFITSEMYNYIMNKYNKTGDNENSDIVMHGGARKKINNKKPIMKKNNKPKKTEIYDLKNMTSEHSNLNDNHKLRNVSDIESDNSNYNTLSYSNNNEDKTRNVITNNDSTSSTSSSSSSLEKVAAKSKKHKGQSRKIKNNFSTESLNLSYISSSAHTGGAYTENSSINNENSSINNENSSINNENSIEKSSTVNTSDINMISD
jgi:bifunctional autolysin